jgi:hypothetical protein
MLLSDWQTYLQNLGAISDAAGQALFAQLQPAIIQYAELRMYRDLDLIDTEESATITLTANSRNATLPTGMIVANSCNIITPAGQAPDAGTRNPCRRVSEQFLDFTFPVAGAAGAVTGQVPLYWSRLDFSNIRFGPPPDQAYEAEFIGTFRPAPLSSTNTSTVLTIWFPDMFVAASMVFLAGYQRDFGAASENPQLSLSWNAMYEDLLKSADIEEVRKKALDPSENRAPPSILPSIQGPPQ